MKSKNSIEEVWRIREEIGAEHGYDVDRLVRVVPRHTLNLIGKR